MLQSIIANLHGRICSLEDEFLVDVNMQEGTYHVRKHNYWGGFTANGLELKLQSGFVAYYSVVVLSKNQTADLKFLNQQFTNAQSGLRQHLQQTRPLIDLNKAVFKEMESNSFLIPVRMLSPPESLRGFKDDNFCFLYSGSSR